MKRFLLVLVVALALPAAAAAKGPDQATISGPGLKTVTLGGNGESMGTALGELTESAGLFPASFQTSPNPMYESAPTKSLGSKYRIHFRVPGPQGGTFWIDQDVYPYAKGGALTYTKPGQRIFGSRTPGGWFLGGLALKQTLQQHGLPAKDPGASGTSGTSPALVAGIAIPGALVLAGAGLLYRKRRHQA
jgi:LPXTG-motif cell wall-anchored protein